MSLTMFRPYLAIAAAALLLASCSKKPDLTTFVSDAAGVRAGDSVRFMGTDAGQVERVSPHDGKIRIDFRLRPEFRAQIRVGAKARAVCDLTSGFSSQLRIVGGTIPTSPALPEGAVLPEATAVDLLGEMVRGVAADGASALQDIVSEVKAQAAEEALHQLESVKNSMQKMRNDARSKPSSPISPSPKN